MTNELSLPPPACLAMIICDHIWQDPATGKRTILGTFNELCSPTFPAIHLNLAIYVSLTEASGTMSFRTRIVDVNDERAPVFEANETLKFPGPQAVMDFDIKIETLEFPEPGDYRIQLFVGGEFITERKMMVHHVS